MDLEQELRDTLARARDSNGEPQDGFFHLVRRMDSAEQFDVDLTILDFLMYKAIDLLFEWKLGSDPYSDLPTALVSMTADWREVFKNSHHARRLDSQAAFRSRLLQFVLVFTHRLHDETWTTEESLNELRAQNESRGGYWNRIHHPPALQQSFDPGGEFPLSDDALNENRNRLASTLNMPRHLRRWLTDVVGTPSLHCLLPLFIELTAARVKLDDDWLPTADWFDLAGQFMLQAVIEEYLQIGVYGAEAFNAVFAFGCPGVERWAEEPADVTAMRRLFCDENNPREQNRDWTDIKRRYINELLPQRPSQSYRQAIEKAQARHPYSAFEERLLSFLKYLHDGLVRPDLVRVEEGRINIDGNDLSEVESREMEL